MLPGEIPGDLSRETRVMKQVEARPSRRLRMVHREIR